MSAHDPFAVRRTLATSFGDFVYYSLTGLHEAGLGDVHKLPFSIKILLEAATRNLDEFAITSGHVEAIARWNPAGNPDSEVPFLPARVLLQDFTGVPSVVDLAALRSAMARMGGDAARINPQVPVDLVIDHSVQVDAFGSLAALFINAEKEFERNRERYEFLRWGQQSIENFRVVPPASGIVHQVNLEYLADVVTRRRLDATDEVFPDSLVGTDSHTTMINGLGVLGWGVGGIEAEAVMLGQPIYMLLPDVVGFHLSGKLQEGATATDLVLTVTEMLRKFGVVGKFVEFYGDGLSQLSLPDRATIANMAPEYGATMGFFPVDEETLRFLERTGRKGQVDLVDRYCREQGLFRTDGMTPPLFSSTLSLDLAQVVPSLAGPKRPQDRVALGDVKRGFFKSIDKDFMKAGPNKDDPSVVRWLNEGGALAAGSSTAGETLADPETGSPPPASPGRLPQRTDLYPHALAPLDLEGDAHHLTHGAVVIAAITSCTNTSNPSVMVAAGLLARKAVGMGLNRKPWVKTSLAPGSRVVTRYLDNAGLTPFLEAIGFHTVGYGCTTCIGNSGPLPEAVAAVVQDHDLVAAAVLSGNRNFEGRINPFVKANYLASPPLVVAYALAGTVDIDMTCEPLGHDPNGQPVYLADLWPTQREIADTIAASLSPELYALEYEKIFTGNEDWNKIQAPGGLLFDWQPDSTYVREPSFFQDLAHDPAPVGAIRHARALALLGDSVTTDHISPAGSIKEASPAGAYLKEHGISPADFNSYGSRRGNHEVMMRGTFANIRLKNQLAPGTEGGVTVHVPSGEPMSIYDAAMRYQAEGTPLVVLAGKEYGTGSSRDWAAKGSFLLGIKAVIAESLERIHRSNLVGMGVLPLQFKAGDSWQSLGLTGHERFDIPIDDDIRPGSTITVTATADDGTKTQFDTLVRIDSPVEVRYFKNGGILHTVLRDMLRGERVTA